MALAWTPSARLKQVALERAQPLAASLELTYRCNWRCVFCYNPRHHDRRGLSGAEWLGVLDGLRAPRHALRRPHRGRAAHPPGVPRHRPRRARARLRPAHPDQRRARDRARWPARSPPSDPLAVELSLHGATAATHDRATATPGSFDAMLRGLDRLLARKVGVVLKTPLTRLNEAEMDGMRRIADERGVPWRVDPVLTPRDDGDAGPLAYRASPEAVSRMFRELAALGQLPHEERANGRHELRPGTHHDRRRPRGQRLPLPAVAARPARQRARDPAPVDVGGLDRAPLRRLRGARPRTTAWSRRGARSRPSRSAPPSRSSAPATRSGPTRATSSRPRPPSGFASTRGEVPRGRRPLLRGARAGPPPHRARGDRSASTPTRATAPRRPCASSSPTPPRGRARTRRSSRSGSPPCSAGPATGSSAATAASRPRSTPSPAARSSSAASSGPTRWRR